MTTITVEVPLEIAKKYGKNIVSYKELLRSVEEGFWQDVEVEPKMKLEDFYKIIKTNGSEVAQDSK